MKYAFDLKLQEYFASIERKLRSKPLILGGPSTATDGGGFVGPPGGIIGYLTQKRTTFDETEAAVSGIPTVSASLIDNLNRIRYRIKTLEESETVGKIDVYENNTIVASGVTSLNFDGDVSISNDGEDKVTISINATPSGVDTKTIQWFADGYLATISGYGESYVTVSGETLDSISVIVEEKGTAGSTIIDINKNGTTVFSGVKPNISYNSANNYYSATDLGISLVEGDIITLDIDSVASGSYNLTTYIVITTSGGGGGGGSSSLTVKEIDGDPSVEGVTIINVNNGRLINNGDHSVTIDLYDNDDFDSAFSSSDIADLTGKSHTDLDDIGTYTHSQIDDHINSTSNPHSVDEVDILPIQTGNSGKFLTTNGNNTYWYDFPENYISTSGGGSIDGSLFINGVLDQCVLCVRSISGQTANIFEVQKAGETFFRISSDGYVIANGPGVSLLDTTEEYEGIIYKGGEPFIHNYYNIDNDVDGKNIFIGKDTGNFVMGTTATESFHSSCNIGIGENNLKFTTIGYNNIALGIYSLRDNTTGYDNVSIGYLSLSYIETGKENTALGSYAGRYTTGDKNVFIGFKAGFNEVGSNKLYIENSDSSSPLLYGEFDNDYLKINGDLEVTGNLIAVVSGVASSLTVEEVDGSPSVESVTVIKFPNTSVTDNGDHSVTIDFSIGDYVETTGDTMTGDLTLDESNLNLDNTTASGIGIITKNSLPFIHDYVTTGTSAGKNIFIGENSGGDFKAGDGAYYSYHGAGNIGIGINTLKAIELGRYNIGIGNDCLSVAESADENIAVGWHTGIALTTGYGNTLIGTYAAEEIVSGDENVAVGLGALWSNESGGYNIAIGNWAGWETLGSNSIFIGYGAGDGEEGSNKLYIESEWGETPLIYGEFDNDYLEINGDLEVTNTLHVESNVTVSGYIQSESYKSSDGSSGITDTKNFEDNDGNAHVVVIKDGLITSWTITPP